MLLISTIFSFKGVMIINDEMFKNALITNIFDIIIRILSDISDKSFFDPSDSSPYLDYF